MFRKLSYFCTVLFILAVASDYALSAPPLKWEWRQKYPNIAATERTMDSETRALLRKKYFAGISEKYAAIIISSPTIKVLVVRVQFPDQAFVTTKADAVVLFSSMTNYYLENSYNKLTIRVDVSSNVYALTNTMGYYGSDAKNGPEHLLTDTLAASTTTTALNPVSISYAGYDTIMIMHAGNGQEMTGISTDIWSQWDPAVYTVSNTKFKLGFTIVPEKAAESTQSPLGVICHEFGHQLGLPDLYDTSVAGGTSVCGAWSLMDYPYGVDSNGVNPPHLDPWCKNFLGFLNLSSRKISTSQSSLTWNFIENSGTTGFCEIPISVAPSTEYFVAEMRSTTAGSYDHEMPGSGIVIWHIDDAIASDPTRLADNNINIGVPHRGVDLLIANGSFSAPGHATDAFVQGNTFVTPQSNSFGGVESGIAMTGFSFLSTGASGSLAMIAANPTLGILKLINYPNPAGPGYSHPRSASGILTSIVMKASRPAQQLELTLYNLAGEKIKTVNKDKIGLLADRSKDYSWFYEYDWDGKNDSGENVAPGIYFYRIKADSDTSVGKLAIVR